MGKRIIPHAKPRAPYPPRADVEALIERTENHWYWTGDFTDDPFGDNAPIYRYAPHRKNGPVFVVTRLTWYWEYGNDLKRLTLENTCGVYTCVNPAHWLRKSSSQAAVNLVLPVDIRAWPVQGGRNSVVAHIAHNDAVHALCGSTHERRCDVGTRITCNECVRAWRARGGVFIEAL